MALGITLSQFFEEDGEKEYQAYGYEETAVKGLGTSATGTERKPDGFS